MTRYVDIRDENDEESVNLDGLLSTITNVDDKIQYEILQAMIDVVGDLNVFAYRFIPGQINGIAITPLRQAVDFINPMAVGLLCSKIKFNDKLRELLFYGDKSLIDIVATNGDAESLAHLLDTMPDISKINVEAALTTAILHVSPWAAFKKGKWNTSDESTLKQLSQFMRWIENPPLTDFPTEPLSVEFEGNYDVLELLLDSGAKIDIKTLTKLSALLADPVASFKQGFFKGVPGCTVTLNEAGSNKDVLSLQMYMVSRQGRVSPVPVTATLHVKSLRELIQAKLRELTETRLKTHELKTLHDHVKQLTVDMKEQREETRDMLVYMEGDEQKRKYEVDRTLDESKQKMESLERDFDEKGRDLHDLKKHASKVDEKLLQPKLQQEARQLFMNRPENGLVKHFYRQTATELKGCFIKAHIGTGGFKREADKPLDFVAAVGEILKDHISFPIISGLVSMASKGIALYSDIREWKKSKHLAHHAPIEDGPFCDDFGLTLAEKVYNDVITLTSHEQAKKFSAHAVLIALSSLEKLDGKLDLDPPQLKEHMLNAVLRDKVFNEKLRQLRAKAVSSPVLPAAKAAASQAVAKQEGPLSPPVPATKKPMGFFRKLVTSAA